MTQILALVSAVLLLLSSAGFAQTTPAQSTVYYAEAHRDCAPWDGAAFEVSIQPDAGVRQIKPPTLHIAIWQSPNLPSGGRFQFPDATGKVGAVYLEPPPENVANLRGTVSFVSVTEGKPVEGQFDLMDARGKRYVGKFLAKWIQLRMLCG